MLSQPAALAHPNDGLPASILQEEIRLLQDQRRALLKERPGAYLAAKRQVRSIVRCSHLRLQSSLKQSSALPSLPLPPLLLSNMANSGSEATELPQARPIILTTEDSSRNVKRRARGFSLPYLAPTMDRCCSSRRPTPPCNPPHTPVSSPRGPCPRRWTRPCPKFAAYRNRRHCDLVGGASEEKFPRSRLEHQVDSKNKRGRIFGADVFGETASHAAGFPSGSCVPTRPRDSRFLEQRAQLYGQ